MPVLGATELDSLQADIALIYADVMPDTCYIQRDTSTESRDTENPEIVITETTNKVYDNIPCDYRTATPREAEVVGRLQSSQLIAIEMAPVYNILSSDTGQIYAKGIQPAIRFEIVGVLKESNAVDMMIIAQVV
jgi:hypothetical protein